MNDYYLDHKEAAIVLLVSPQALLRAIKRGEIPCKKIGKKVLIPKEFIYQIDVPDAKKRAEDIILALGGEPIVKSKKCDRLNR